MGAGYAASLDSLGLRTLELVEFSILAVLIQNHHISPSKQTGLATIAVARTDQYICLFLLNRKEPPFPRSLTPKESRTTSQNPRNPRSVEPKVLGILAALVVTRTGTLKGSVRRILHVATEHSRNRQQLESLGPKLPEPPQLTDKEPSILAPETHT